ncbi:MAG: hypothetical protein EOO41_03060 [Methanobacteriota archaeon]|nr:MAG: hypothetical protein EOO41_03060 [Euryarchaeota archaeon]
MTSLRDHEQGDDATFDAALAAVAEYRQATRQARGTYVLRDSALPLFDFCQLRLLEETSANDTLDVWRARRVKDSPLSRKDALRPSELFAASRPLVPAPLPCHPAYTRVRRLLHTVSFIHMLKHILLRFMSPGPDATLDAVLLHALHTFTLALHTWPSDASPTSGSVSVGGSDSESSVLSGVSVADTLAACLCAPVIDLPHGLTPPAAPPTPRVPDEAYSVLTLLLALVRGTSPTGSPLTVQPEVAEGAAWCLHRLSTMNALTQAELHRLTEADEAAAGMLCIPMTTTVRLHCSITSRTSQMHKPTRA